MSSVRALKSRIRSVGNTRQITKAMQLVSASKMRRAQESDKASAPYAIVASELLTYLSRQGVTDGHPLFEKRPVKSRLVIVVAADKGLAGAYNSNILKEYTNILRSDREAGVSTQTIAIGRRAAQFATRLKNVDIIGVYDDLPDRPSGRMVNTILDMVISGFRSGEIDAIDVVYTKFINSISQQVSTDRLLPAGFEEQNVNGILPDACYEPSVDEVLDNVVTRLIGSQLFQALLDAKASEHSMRMVAMKNATDNANDLVDDLTLEMNKARQGAITQELAEISGGVEAMKE